MVAATHYLLYCEVELVRLMKTWDWRMHMDASLFISPSMRWFTYIFTALYEQIIANSIQIMAEVVRSSSGSKQQQQTSSSSSSSSSRVDGIYQSIQWIDWEHKLSVRSAQRGQFPSSPCTQNWCTWGSKMWWAAISGMSDSSKRWRFPRQIWSKNFASTAF